MFGLSTSQAIREWWKPIAAVGVWVWSMVDGDLIPNILDWIGDCFPESKEKESEMTLTEWLDEALREGEVSVAVVCEMADVPFFREVVRSHFGESPNPRPFMQLIPFKDDPLDALVLRYVLWESLVAGLRFDRIIVTRRTPTLVEDELGLRDRDAWLRNLPFRLNRGGKVVDAT